MTRGQTLETKIPVELTGESPGVKNMGGILEFHQNEILVRCRPSQLPSVLELDISKLDLGGSLQIKDLPSMDGVEFVADPDSNIVTCVGSASGRAGARDEDTDAEEAGTDDSNSEEENTGAENQAQASE